jgi:choline dehydrogenase-like flavoprotein
LRAHDHANLFVVGGMVFPTAGMHPPTLTIAALALRAALAIQQSFAG